MFYPYVRLFSFSFFLFCSRALPINHVTTIVEIYKICTVFIFIYRRSRSPNHPTPCAFNLFFERTRLRNNSRKLGFYILFFTSRLV